MDTEDADVLPGSSNSRGEHGSGIEEFLESNSWPSVIESQPIDNDVEGGNMNKELGINEGDVGNAGCTIGGNNLLLCKGVVGVEEGATCTEVLGLQATDTVAEESVNQVNSVLSKSDDGTEEGELPMDTEVDMDLDDSPVREVHVEVAESVACGESLNSFSSRVNGEIDFPDGQIDGIIPENKSSSRNISGVKRARRTYDEEHASVQVAYNFLTSASKRKLGELLQKWSEWHSQHGYSTQDADEVLESGEETYFPALRVGMDNKAASAVSFRIENRTWKRLNDGDTPLDAKSVPLYDREYALGLTSTDGSTNVEGGLDIMDAAARCFNCGGYNHSLKECPKPRNNAAVNNARKQHKSKRNQNSGSCFPIRYYQKSSGGKYGDLKPGSLAAETRQVLGLGDLDPPPWLNRMRELGYPPGYLDPDEDENQPSGITIFADKDTKNEKEDGEIVETDDREPQRRMSVEFPGINAPIPKDADERRWEVGSSSFDSFLNQSHRRLNHSSEPTSRWHYHERRQSRGFVDDGPPSVDLVFSPPSSSYPPRYGNYEPSYSSESHSFLRSHSERDRRSSLAYEDYSSHGSPSYPPLDRRSSPQDIGSARSAYESDDRWDKYSLDHSFRSNDSHDHRRQRRR